MKTDEEIAREVVRPIGGTVLSTYTRLVRAGRLAGLRFAEEWLASVTLNENGKRVHMIIKDEIAELEGEDA